MNCSSRGCATPAPGFDPRTARAWCEEHTPAGVTLSPYPDRVRLAPVQLEIEDREPDEDIPLPSVARETSAEAAATARQEMRGVRRLIYNAISAAGEQGATCEELELGLKVKHQTASAAIVAIRDMGLIGDCGRRRNTSSGRPAVAWVQIR